MKKNGVLKIDSETLQKMRELSFELSSIEKKRVSMGDIPRRLLSEKEIVERLKLGSTERRLGRRR